MAVQTTQSVQADNLSNTDLQNITVPLFHDQAAHPVHPLCPPANFYSQLFDTIPVQIPYPRGYPFLPALPEIVQNRPVHGFLERYENNLRTSQNVVNTQ